jgi:hypothetical protein
MGGNYLLMSKVSRNPDESENEPSGLFNACHHANEPGAMAPAMVKNLNVGNQRQIIGMGNMGRGIYFIRI